MSKDFDDISELAAIDTDTFQLNDPVDDEPLFRRDESGERKPVMVTIFGPGSEEQARAEVALSNRQMKRFRKKGDVVLTSGDVAADVADQLTAITKGFENLKHNGEMVGTDRERIRALFLDRKLSWIGDAINERRKSWANFMKKSETS